MKLTRFFSLLSIEKSVSVDLYMTFYVELKMVMPIMWSAQSWRKFRVSQIPQCYLEDDDFLQKYDEIQNK